MRLFTAKTGAIYIPVALGFTAAFTLVGALARLGGSPDWITPGALLVATVASWAWASRTRFVFELDAEQRALVRRHVHPLGGSADVVLKIPDGAKVEIRGDWHLAVPVAASGPVDPDAAEFWIELTDLENGRSVVVSERMPAGRHGARITDMPQPGVRRDHPFVPIPERRVQPAPELRARADALALALGTAASGPSERDGAAEQLVPFRTGLVFLALFAGPALTWGFGLWSVMELSGVVALVTFGLLVAAGAIEHIRSWITGRPIGAVAWPPRKRKDARTERASGCGES